MKLDALVDAVVARVDRMSDEELVARVRSELAAVLEERAERERAAAPLGAETDREGQPGRATPSR